MVISAQEVMTPLIPPEHIIYGCKVNRVELESQWGVKFKPEFQDLNKNENLDFCVKEYSKFFPIPEPDKSSKTVEIYHNGKVEVQRA